MTDVLPSDPGVERRRLLGGAAVLGIVALLAAVAVAAGGGRPVAGDPASASVPQLVVDYAFSTLVVLVVALVLAILLALTQVRRTADPRPTGSWRTFVSAFLVLLLIVGLYRFIRPPDSPPVFDPSRIGTPQPASPRDAREQARPGRAEFRWEVALVAALASAGALAYLLRRRGPEPDSEPDDAAGAVSAVLDEALDDLRAEQDARRAVIAAYARLEATLARHGLPRRPAEAPLEYLSRLLLELEVRPAAVLDLTQLFEQAKFSRRRIDAAMKDEAIDALVAVRDDLRAAA